MLIERIRELCIGQSITLAELERRTGISNGTIAKLEKSSPRLDLLIKVADYFGVTLDYLCSREKENPRHQEDDAERYELFFNVLDSLSDSDRQLLLEKAHSLANLQKLRDDLLKF